jgi:putative sterol carrier protein
MASFADIALAMQEAVEQNKGEDGDKVRKKFNGTVLFQIDNEEPFTLNVSKNKPPSPSNASTTTPPPPDLVVTASLPVRHELLAQTLTPQQAFVKGKIQIKGKMALAMKLELILNATRKHLMKERTSRL